VVWFLGGFDGKLFKSEKKLQKVKGNIINILLNHEETKKHEGDIKVKRFYGV
jgi:hypothetical protein